MKFPLCSMKVSLCFMKFLLCSLKFPGCFKRFTGCSIKFPVCSIKFPVCSMRFPASLMKFPVCSMKFPLCSMNFPIHSMDFSYEGSKKSLKIPNLETWPGLCNSQRTSKHGINSRNSQGTIPLGLEHHTETSGLDLPITFFNIEFYVPYSLHHAPWSSQTVWWGPNLPHEVSKLSHVVDKVQCGGPSGP